MNIHDEIESEVKSLIKAFSQAPSHAPDATAPHANFIYDLLLAYKTPKATITRLKKGDHNLSKRADQIILKKKLFFQSLAATAPRPNPKEDIHATFTALEADPATHRHAPRFIIVTDYKTLLAKDTKTHATLDIKITRTAQHFEFFLPLAGIEKSALTNEAAADIKAAEKMARLYDEIIKNNSLRTTEEIHALNVFLSRLLFCFFAEDTGIFQPDAFTQFIDDRTAKDGKNLNTHLAKLFATLNIPENERTTATTPTTFQKFPYVNGKLFNDPHPTPTFTAKSRKLIIECGQLDWAEINPDIFGSMLQAVVHHQGGKRSNLGMHYTSVPNIMKVIKPLFLDELTDAFSKNFDDPAKLQELITRLANMRLFDPACGSGNFLIIAYKEICELEMKVFQRIKKLMTAGSLLPLSQIRLSQFYGIEIDDFAHEAAILSLWLAQHQMNVKFKAVFGKSNATLPLKEGGKIVCDNATRCDWEKVCPKPAKGKGEVFVFGNPPYLGGSKQDKEQKQDMNFVFADFKNIGQLDYISCWFYKGASYIQSVGAKLAFVATSSICQGEQVPLLWRHLLKGGVEIDFAYQSFKWANKAKYNAGVICIIVGLRETSPALKFLFTGDAKHEVQNINAYLSAGENVFIDGVQKPLSALPPMCRGSSPIAGDNLFLTEKERNQFILSNPKAEKFICKIIGSKEFIRGEYRYCLWIEDGDIEEAQSMPAISKRLEKVRNFRLKSVRPSTRKYADKPYRFIEISHKKTRAIIIPRVSSERRSYIPFGFLSSGVIISDTAHAIYDAEEWIFGMITSAMHMVWVNVVAGRLGTGYRYSATICYNTFPFPDLNEEKKKMLKRNAREVLGAREYHSEKTFAQLYDPDKMPKNLLTAHQDLDLAVERCYRPQPFTSDTERLEVLFKRYEQMTQEQQGPQLFPKPAKIRKKRKKA